MRAMSLPVHQPMEVMPCPLQTNDPSAQQQAQQEQNQSAELQAEERSTDLPSDGAQQEAEQPEADEVDESAKEDEEDAQQAEDSNAGEEQQPKPRARQPAVPKFLAVVQQGPGRKLPSARKPSEEPQSAASDEDNYTEDQEVVLERAISPEQAAADMATIRNMPEMVSICEFLFLFRKQLGLDTVLTFHSLMDALVTSPGPGMLTQLHTELLKGIVSSKALDERNWPHYLAQRLQYAWSGVSKEQGPPPFQAEKHQEAQAYAALPAKDRVLTLLALCDLRLERDDLRYPVEDAVEAATATTTKKKAPAQGPAAKPPPAPAGRSSRSAAPAAAGPSAGGPSSKRKGQEDEEDDLDAHRLRREPLGVDASGFIYHWLDWYEGQVEGGMDLGFILAREPTPAPPKGGAVSPAAAQPAKGKQKGGAGGKQKRQKYQLPPQAVAGQWEVVACSQEELETFQAKLQRSLRPLDKKMAEQVGSLLAILQERLDEQDRWRKAKERTKRMLGLDVGLNLGRSVRQRKQVSYRDDAYDKAMNDALKTMGGGRDHDDGAPSNRRKAREAAREAAQEAAGGEAGRRGRSRGSDTDLIALDMGGGRVDRPPRARGGAAAAGQQQQEEAGAEQEQQQQEQQEEAEAEQGKEEQGQGPEKEGAGVQGMGEEAAEQGGEEDHDMWGQEGEGGEAMEVEVDRGASEGLRTEDRGEGQGGRKEAEGLEQS